MTTQSERRHRQYWANEARFSPATPRRPQFLIDPTAPEELKAEWRRLTWAGMDAEKAAEQVGIVGRWE